MSMHERPIRDERVVEDRYSSEGHEVVDERYTETTSDSLNGALRATGAVAGAVPVVIGIVALIRMDWDAGFSDARDEVLSMTFTPIVAIVTLVLGLITMAVAASPTRESKLVWGGLLACVGLGILLAGDSRENIDLEAGHGWMALLVGAVLLATGAFMRNWRETRRSVRSERV